MLSMQTDVDRNLRMEGCDGAPPRTGDATGVVSGRHEANDDDRCEGRRTCLCASRCKLHPREDKKIERGFSRRIVEQEVVPPRRGMVVLPRDWSVYLHVRHLLRNGVVRIRLPPLVDGADRPTERSNSCESTSYRIRTFSGRRTVLFHAEVRRMRSSHADRSHTPTDRSTNEKGCPRPQRNRPGAFPSIPSILVGPCSPRGFGVEPFLPAADVGVRHTLSTCT